MYSDSRFADGVEAGMYRFRGHISVAFAATVLAACGSDSPTATPSAATAHGKGDHLSAHELSKQAHEHSREAHELSEKALEDAKKSTAQQR